MPICSVSWLHDQLSDPPLVILDCRFSLADADWGRQQYELAHIPGAHYLDLNQDLSSPVKEHGGRHPLPDATVLAAKLAAIGIERGTTPVVVYDEGMAFAAHCWWLLRYLGHDRVQVLDGGFKAWQAAGYAVTAVSPSPSPPGNFIPQVRSHWVVDIDQVKARPDSPGVALVDSREGDRYRGEREPIDPIAGHIPGAINYPWAEMLSPDGHLHPASVQQQRWSDLQSCDEIIVYCGSGVTACANLLSLELAGIHSGRLYAGSWSDWCSYLSSPNRPEPG